MSFSKNKPPGLRRVPLRPAIGLLRVSHLHQKQRGCRVYHKSRQLYVYLFFCILMNILNLNMDIIYDMSRVLNFILIYDNLYVYIYICKIHIYMHNKICRPLSNRFSPHGSECVGMGTGYTLIGSLALVSPC